ncbi:dCTP deaminase [Flagellimonas algicola]|uniref:Deoxycytidine triphosphate deaminase n=1 Tax=Flagellimonas algicola TaxID=2583815 RepID=A0ABY2WJ06_9FLAO|nr:deoxycytidine triphosphate deaminase [Allomuricauda algicola]TMU54820.1 deoxycytidine triphosphate deaminase [Allomuricauda algicola]
MAFLANEELKKLLKTCISENKFSEDNLQNASYELTLGNEVYTNNDSVKTILYDEKPQFELKPGQFAILITDEIVKIPAEYIGFISLKFGFKFKGLVNISGFHVDPGFQGKLKFSVYNAGSKSIILEKGSPYFVLWISQLTSKLNKQQEYNGSHKNQSSITPDDIMKIQGDLLDRNTLKNLIDENATAIELNRIQRNGFWLNVRWISGIVIGLLLTLNIGIWLNKNKKDNALREEIKNTQAPKEIKNILANMNVDSVIRNEIDLDVAKKNADVGKNLDSILNQKIDSIIGIKFDEIRVNKDRSE